jgi:hypothetical protein
MSLSMQVEPGSKNVFQDQRGVHAGADPLTVVSGQHPSVFVAELIGDPFEWYSGVGRDRGCTVSQHVGSPAITETRRRDHPIELGSHLRWGRWMPSWFVKIGPHSRSPM